MSLTQITSHGIADGAIVNADLHSAAAIVLSKLNTTGTASSSTFLRGDGAWTAIDLSNLNASNLTSGTVPDARFPSTLPALNGSALTALNASNLASGTVGTARLGSGTASSSTFLRGDGSWQTISADGGNAATLDGLDSVEFLRSNTADNMSAKLTLNQDNDDQKLVLAGTNNPYIRWQEGTTNKAYIQWNASGYLEIVNQEDNSRIKLQDNLVFTNDGFSNTYKIWNESNDGSGSGLDADTVDGIQAASFLRADTSDTVTGGPWHLTNTNSSWAYRFQNNTASNASVYMSHGAGYGMHIRNDTGGTSHYLLQVYGSNGTDFKIRGGDALVTSGGNTMWHAGNDGSGSGLDADSVDGIAGSSFLRSDAADTFSGDLTSSGSARLLLKKTDNNVSDHIIFYNGTTRVGEIGCHDNSWLRINQSTGNNIYTPRYIRADGGFFVDGTSKGINGSGNFFGGTIAGASDYGTLLRSNADDTFSGALTSSARNNGIFGTYDSYKTDHIWSMGTAYKNHSSGTNFGNLYGLAYKHTNNSTGGTMGGSHQMVWCINGDPRGAIGSNIWTKGEFYANSNSQIVMHKGNDGSGSGFDADTLDGVQGSSFLRSDASDSATGTLTVRDVKLSAGYHLQRSDHHSGHLEGSYNNVGANSYKSNPIYSIGSSYNPGDAALSNFYGIGYSHNNASFIGSSLSSGSNGWGMYVAANGSARIWLNGSYGTIQSTGQHYVSNNVVWNAGNDGSGSGLDADTCDGQHLSTTSNVTFMSVSALSIVATSAFVLGDDKPIKFGNTETAPDATIDWHTPSWGDRLEINVPGAGDIYYIVNGSGEYHLFKLGGDTVMAMQGWVKVYKDLVPSSDNSLDIGSSWQRFDDIWATNSSIQTSDKNEKNTIVDTDLGLSFINKLKPVSYKFNNKTRTHYGLIAQDVETLLSDISKPTTDFAGFIKAENPDELYDRLDKEDGKIPEGKDIGDVKKAAFTSYGLRYNEFIAPLIKAVQELSAEVETLKTKVSALESA